MTSTAPDRTVGHDAIARWRRNGVAFHEEVWPGRTTDPIQREAWEYASGDGVKYNFMMGSAGTSKTYWAGIENLRRLFCYGTPTEPPRGIAFSCSGDQLKIGLQAEMSDQIAASPLMRDVFEINNDGVKLKDKSDSRWLQFRTFPAKATPEQQGKALSGLHHRFAWVCGDEVGTVAPIMGDRADQAMTNCEHGGVFFSANPDATDGLAHEIITNRADRFAIHTTTGDPDDPNRSPRVNIDWARRKIAEARLGRDDPWVRIYVLNKFPLGAIDTLLTEDQVREAMELCPRPDEYDWAATIIGCDVARYGLDKSTIFTRQHSMVWEPITLAQVNGVQGAAIVAQEYGVRGGNAICIDGTGGYGGSWVDQLQVMGFAPIEVNACSTDVDPRMADIRSGSWWRMCEMIRERKLALPKSCRNLIGDLSTPKMAYAKDKFCLEPFDAVKKRLNRSPDHGSGLAHTFVVPIAAPGLRTQMPSVAEVMAHRRPTRASGRDYYNRDD